MRPYQRSILLGTFLCTAACGASHAQGTPAIQDAGAVAPVAAGQLAQMELRLGELTAALQQATGRMEEMEHEIQTLRAHQEQTAAAPHPAPAAASQEDAPATGQLMGDTHVPATDLDGLGPDALYERGRERLIGGMHEEARRIFGAFLERFPENALAANARYWIGDSYALEKNYAAAVGAFMDAYQKDPTGPKAPDSLFKVGLSLSRLDKTKEACVTFTKLRTDFPDLETSLARLVDKETAKLKCPA